MTDRAVTFHPQMLADLEWWRDHDQEMGAKAVELIEEASATPESGYGRPKRLATLANVWSRRISRTHRLFYLLRDGEVRFLACRGHEIPPEMRRSLFLGEEV